MREQHVEKVKSWPRATLLDKEMAMLDENAWRK